jgi:hypothetical protein
VSLSGDSWEIALTGDLSGKLKLQQTAQGQPDWTCSYEPID